MASKTFGSYKESDSVLGYLAYAANVTQSATSAPSASVSRNDFGSTTLTWARTSAGIYTVTASTAIFTAGKTVVTLPPALTSLSQIGYVATSTTVITVTTSVLSVIATVLTATVADNLFNTFVIIQVWD